MEATIPAVSAKESTKGFWGNKRAALHGQARFIHAWWIAQRRACGHWGSVQGRGRGQARRDNCCFREKCLSHFETGQEKSVPGLKMHAFLKSSHSLTLFYPGYDTQTATNMCHCGPIPDGTHPNGGFGLLGLVVIT